MVGQNLYIYKQSRKSAATNWERAIVDWYNEVELFGKERVKPFRWVHSKYLDCTGSVQASCLS